MLLSTPRALRTSPRSSETYTVQNSTRETRSPPTQFSLRDESADLASPLAARWGKTRSANVYARRLNPSSVNLRLISLSEVMPKFLAAMRSTSV